MNNCRSLSLFVGLPLLLLAGACKKEVVTGATTAPPPPVVVTTPTPPVAIPDTARPKPVDPAVPSAPAAPMVDVQNMSYDFLQLRGKMQFDNGDDKQEATVNIRLKRDSIIWASVTKVGIEGARIVITPDTIVMLDRLHKTYFAGNFKALKRRYRVPVTFEMLQAALVANYLPGEGAKDASEGADAAVQAIHHDQQKLSVDQYVNREKKRLVKMSVKDARSGNAMTADYSDFKVLKEGEREFPYATLMSIVQAPGPNAAPDVQPRNILISLNHKNVTVPEGRLDFPLAIPADYERK